MHVSTFKTLSVVIPVYNEEAHLEEIVRRVINQPLPGGLARELIVINDGSTDATWSLVQALPAKYPSISFKLVNKTLNQGKGAALRDGFDQASGDIVIIQDADLEYDPADYPKLLAPILDGKADVVYGSRFIGEPHRVMYYWHQLANNFLTTLSNMLTNINLTDIEVCYKVFTREVVRRLKIKSRRFGVEPEITAKIARMKLNGKRLRIYETGISYDGRTYGEGKKIGWKDALSAIIHIIRFRLMD
ncbi:MAG TPA: glycosyltransferase family 2 protein [Smithellaceae bacterium]|jgi:glycosyltransferase involved in cell wall biosynthesis|nr:glycosyltransferase family 2 protein [Smithellaceae bacterium]HQF83916.1 glycosyltransferase family 2 protein [Smithellaceae bacterium]HQG80148.1 glycosyltransferase family 2 protein [Smithellaceae bacterium]